MINILNIYFSKTFELINFLNIFYFNSFLLFVCSTRNADFAIYIRKIKCGIGLMQGGSMGQSETVHISLRILT